VVGEDQVVALLRARLAELDGERHRLESALKTLTGDVSSSSTGRAGGRGQRSKSGRSTVAIPRKRARGRVRQGQREQQFLQAVAAQPGASPRELAETIGVSPNQVYGLARRAKDSRKITKQGKGFRVRG
jgi:hypothetical protein